MTPHDYIEHYASPYYDPVYQHQYYLDHKEDKRYQRTLKSKVDPDETLNRNATLYSVRQGVSNAQKRDTTSVRTTYEAQITAAKEELANKTEQLTKKLSDAIEAINTKNSEYRSEHQKASKKLDEKYKQQQKANSKAYKNANTKSDRESERNISMLKRMLKATNSKSTKIALQRQINALEAKKEEERYKNRLDNAILNAKTKKQQRLDRNALSNQLQANLSTSNAEAAKQRKAITQEKKELHDNATAAIQATREVLNSALTSLRKNYQSTLKSELEKTRNDWETSSNSTSSWQSQIEAASKKAHADLKEFENKKYKRK